MGTKKFTTVIRIELTQSDGGYWTLTSPDLPELMLGGTDPEAIQEDIPEAIRRIFQENYHTQVQAVPGQMGMEQAPSKTERPWIAIPQGIQLVPAHDSSI